MGRPHPDDEAALEELESVLADLVAAATRRTESIIERRPVNPTRRDLQHAIGRLRSWRRPGAGDRVERSVDRSVARAGTGDVGPGRHAA